jgi:uncharacterized protein
MSSLEAILSTINSDAPVKDVRICLRSTMVLSDHLGLAYSFPLGLCPASQENRWRTQPGESLTDKSARELADFALSEDWTQASVGVAAINSLINPDPSKLILKSGSDIATEKARGANVVMVGHFSFAQRIREVAKNFSILELLPQEGDLHASKVHEVVPGADLLIITGTTLVNHTFDELVRLAEGAYIVLLGPTTILSQTLFDYGVDAICGVRITEPEETIRYLSQGGSFRDIQGIDRIALMK